MVHVYSFWYICSPILARSRLTSNGSVNFAMEETDKDNNDAQDLLAAPKKLKAPVPPRMVKPRSAEEKPSKKTSSTKRVTIVTGNSKKGRSLWHSSKTLH